jgi:F0F1-type ATP synthase membrane subunit b/b'
MVIVALIILQLVIFSALIYFFRKIMNQNVVVATQHLDELRHDYEKKQKQIDAQMEEAKAQAQAIVDQARGDVEKQKSEILTNAQKERDRVTQEARAHAEEMVQQAEKSRYQLLAELEHRITRESVQRASELIGQVLPEPFKKEVHAHWTEELLKGKLTQLEDVRVPSDIQGVKIISAFPLEEAQRQLLSKNIKNKLGKDIQIKEEVDPKIVAGLIISMGSLLIDGSLKNKIEEQAKSVQHQAHN